QGNHSLALRKYGSIVAWGDNTDADGLYAGQSVVPPHATNALLLAAGNYHSASAKADGTMLCWGDDSLGQCAPPGDLSFPAMLAGGAEHTIALTTNGGAVAWGSDYEGQCDLPPNLSGAIAIAAGAHHSLVLFESYPFVPRLFASDPTSGG